MMNILYISKLDGRPWIGPTYSIPSQIQAQSRYDNVFWYNLDCGEFALGRDKIAEWRQFEFYHDKTEYPDEKISKLPHPFCKPDLIVLEQCYPFAKSPIRKEMQYSGIPYVVIPRGEFTKNAQKKKALKKIIGNFLFQYPQFTNGAAAIQCLTSQENEETNISWGKTRIILPNGTDLPDVSDTEKADTGKIVCVSIGRYEPYQKGLDLLIDAVLELKEILTGNNIKFELYGSDMEHKREGLEETVKKYGLSSLICFHDAVFGNDKDKILRQANVFLIPSRFEGHPTGLLEALAYGLPSLVTTGANMRREVEEYDAGWGADNTVESISSVLRLMISDKDKFPEKGKNARDLAGKYSWDSIAKRSHDEYLKVIVKK